MKLPATLLLLAACSSSSSTSSPPAPTKPTTKTADAAPAAPAARSSIFQEDIDKTADPCNDFYQYANGTWRTQNPIPANMDRWSRRWKSGEDNKTRLADILDDVSKKTDWPAHSVEQQIGDFYGACMDTAAIDAAGAKPLDATFAEIAAMKTPADIQAELRKLATQGLALPFYVVSTPDPHDPTNTIANVSAGGLGLPDRDYYSKTEPRFVEARDKYKVHVAKMFTLLGKSDADAKAAADTVFAFESRLAAASMDNVTLRDPKATDHPMDFDGLAKAAPDIDWAGYWKDAGLTEGHTNLDQPAFVAAVDKELTKTPVADWQTYLTWHVVNADASWLAKPFDDEDFDFNAKYLGGVAEQKPRRMRCAELTDGALGEALGQKYVEKYFPPEAKARASELIQNELAALKDIIGELSWMSDATKQKALAKLAKFNVKVGYPDKWKDYSSVTVARGSLLDDLVATRTFNVADDRGYIGKPTDRGRWGMTPPTSNAYYNPLMNEIVFPAGILVSPAFDVNASDAFNYGGIGVVIGHEISHGFDDQGAQYDGDGKLSDWWTPDDYTAFKKRAQCVVDQFDGYFIEPNIHHNGKLVLGESIGDLGGVKIAYTAFEKAHAAHAEPAPTGMTAEQEFFLAWGQWRGDEIRPETQRKMIQGDPHPVAKFRVIGPLSNFQPFADAYKCGEKAAMVRPAAQRCEVW